MGAIADRAKAFIPVTWDALNGDGRYGPTVLQGRVERAKYEVLGATAPLEGAEVTLSDDLQEHIAKRSVVKIIPAGIEFWADRPISITTTGTQEVVAYESRINQLRELYKQLQQEIALEEPTYTPIVQTSGFAAVSDGQSDILITENPFDFPRTYGDEGV